VKEDLVKSINEFLNLEIIAEIVLILALTGVALVGIHRFTAFLADRFPRWRMQISSSFPVLRLAIWLAVVMFIVTVVIKPSLNTLIAISATAGVAFGLGAQEVVKNLLAGVLIMFDRPFRIGDMIKVDSHYGEVTEIGLRTSRIHTFDDSIITLPNGMFLNKAVTNTNVGALVEQVVMEFSLPGNVNVREVKELMHEAALCSPYVYRKNPVNVLVEDRYDHGFLSIFKVKAYVMDLRFERLIASDITERIKEEILARDILPREALLPYRI
jgi:small-conductance mechanosensitive channel